MVQHMLDKFNECKLVKGGSIMPSGDKQQPVVKKVALRELPSETTNILPKPPGSSPVSKDRGTNVDFLKVLGAKRQQPDSSLSPPIQHPTGNNGANGHLVYVRRKLDTEAGKINSSDNAGSVGSPESRKCINGTIREPKIQQDQIQEPKASSLPLLIPVPAPSQSISSGAPSLSYSLGKTNIVLAVPESNDSMVTIVSPVRVDSQQPSNQYWRERFLRLQMFLKHCDQSSQEEYIRMLRSLPAVGRSKHAVELEKRAIQLMLEEGKELHRMKVLNVLGKALPKDDASISTQTPSSLQLQRNEKMVEGANFPSQGN